MEMNVSGGVGGLVEGRVGETTYEHTYASLLERV